MGRPISVNDQYFKAWINKISIFKNEYLASQLSSQSTVWYRIPKAAGLIPTVVFSWSIVNSNSDSEHRVHFFIPWELPEFTWKSTENWPEIAHEQLLGVLPPPPHFPVATALPR
jgi:hypothetical protein